MKYKIVFRGKFNPDVNQNEILENLSELFDESIDDIHQKFFSLNGREKILISGLSNSDAVEYKDALVEAGVEVDIDLDLDMDDFASFDTGIADVPTQKPKMPTKKSAPIQNQSDTEVSLTLNTLDDLAVQPTTAKPKQNDIRSRFLEAQEFTLMKSDDDAQMEEENRVAKLKRIAKKSHEHIEIDDRDVGVEPPLFHSGVRIGRLRFLCRITFAMAILMVCLNVLPLYLKSYMGNGGFIPSFFFVFFAFMFVIMIISQRFCDIDNLTIGTMAFVVIILGTLMISFFINEYYALSDAKIKFAKDFLQNNSMSQNFFSMQKVLDAYLTEASQKHLIQQIDSIIKWIVYIFVIGGAILLFALPGVEGNNQFGSPSETPNAKSYAIFAVSFLVFIYALSYPYSTKEHRAEHKLYQIELYEYLGLLKPLPDEFETVYREYLQKTQQKLSN